jgi:ATP-dependent exoDNAse (exonuclease V) beta subunit
MVKQRLLEDGLCSALEAVKIIAQIENLLKLPELEACFLPQNKRYSERTLILSDGTLLRPDRVVETEQETIVIDYKTGKVKPSHTKQIEGYMQTLQGMGKKSLKGYLVYLHENPTIQTISI